MLYNNLDIFIYPELAAASFKKNSSDIYMCWSILRALDNKNMSSGYIQISCIRDVIKNVLNISESQITKKIKDGIGIYWHKPKGYGKKRYTGLISLKNVSLYLSPDIFPKDNFVLTTDDILSYSGLQNIKSLLLLLIITRDSRELPISLNTISLQTGLSISTIKRYIRNVDVFKFLNYKTLYYFEDKQQACAQLNLLNNQDCIFLKKINNLYYIVKKMPNSYSNISFRRRSCKTTPHIIKKIIKTNINYDCLNKMYYLNNKNIPETGYIQGDIFKSNDKIITLWNDI